MAANVLFESLSGLHDVEDKFLENNCVLVWISSTHSWAPRPYNDGSGDPGSVVIGDSVVGGHPSHVLYVDETGKLNQLESIPQNLVKDLIADLEQKASKKSPYLNGEPKAAFPNLDDNSLRIATTGWVQRQGFEKAGSKGQAHGYPSLDSTGRIPVEQLPMSVTGTVEVGARRSVGKHSPVNADPGTIKFSVSLSDKAVPNSSLFKGSDHGNKLCYKDDQGYVHELYS